MPNEDLHIEKNYNQKQGQNDAESEMYNMWQGEE